MAIIKKPIRKTLFYLASLAGVVSVLTIKLISGSSQANLSQLENQINKTLPSVSGIVIPFVKADVPIVSCATDDDDDDTGGGGSSGSCDDDCDPGYERGRDEDGWIDCVPIDGDDRDNDRDNDRDSGCDGCDHGCCC